MRTLLLLIYIWGVLGCAHALSEQGAFHRSPVIAVAVTLAWPAHIVLQGTKTFYLEHEHPILKTPQPEEESP